uniref:Uncharacterized protein n=1 Tax=Setaria italica TaxID=4555 RepID=K4A453_SETIT
MTIHPALFLFQMQYKLTIRSLALLGVNLYYVKFSNLQFSRPFPSLPSPSSENWALAVY